MHRDTFCTAQVSLEKMENSIAPFACYNVTMVGVVENESKKKITERWENKEKVKLERKQHRQPEWQTVPSRNGIESKDDKQSDRFGDFHSIS